MYKIIYSQNRKFIAGFADYVDAAGWFHQNCSVAHCEIVATGQSKMPTDTEVAEWQLSQAKDKLEDAHKLLDSLEPISAKVDMDAIERIEKSFRD